MKQAINDFLKDKTARELVENFDVDFDVPFKYNHCIGLLEMLDAYEQDGAENDFKLAERVGAWWCRIVRYDVLYRILDGLESITASRADANKLRERVLKRNFNSANLDAQLQFMAYAAARWHDGAAKIYYRCNDYSEARLLFKQAEELANQANLWYCLPDIQSNLVRAEYEEHQTVGHEASLKEKYQELCLQTLNTANSHQIFVPESCPDEGSLQNRLAQEREFLRGLASIFHNLSLEEKKSDIESSLKSSQRSEYICRGLSDKYRLAQALNYQGILAFEKDPDTARSRFQEVLTMPWIRGQRIAKQKLAKLNARAGKCSEALDSIVKLFEELQEERQRRGGDVGLDIRFYSFTVDALKDVLKQAEEQKLSPEALDGYRQRLEKEEMEMIRSVRKVVKIGNYKRDFAKTIYPLYLKQIAKHIKDIPNSKDQQQERHNRERLEEGFTLVEEASSRELLDLLQSGAWSDVSLPNWEESPDVEEIPQEDLTPATPAETKSQPHRGGIRLIRYQDNDSDSKRRDYLNRCRQVFENLSLSRPIPISQHNPEIAHEIRNFTANNPGLAIARYFFYGDDPKNRQLGVYVFRKTNVYYQRLNWQEVEKLLKFWDEHSPNSTPGTRMSWFAEKMEQLFDLLLQPIWDLIVDNQPLEQLKENHLVIVPSNELFRLPIHAALVSGTNTPLAAAIPLSFSVSATAYLTRGRHLLRRQPVEKNDDLGALIMPDVSGKELAGLNWSPEHFHIAGQPPDGIGKHCHCGEANWSGLQRLIKEKPEFFVYGGHGNYHESFNTLGAYLELQRGILTQFHIATMGLPRNKLTILGACLSGRGVDLDGGEVAGFIRAFMAAGCGALGVTLWPVEDREIASSIKFLLSKSRDFSGSFDVVQELYEYYRCHCQLWDKTSPIEACPLVLYL